MLTDTEGGAGAAETGHVDRQPLFKGFEGVQESAEGQLVSHQRFQPCSR
ncbi:MAG: hypothetical protein M3017_01240 [Actinomycetota bacterium]|nr:hypothetical protein [Actinomycetota bacterium]